MALAILGNSTYTTRFSPKPRSSIHSSHALQIIPGFILVVCWWPIAWLQIRPFSNYYFFPLWLGYILVVDGLVELRTGTSLFSRSRLKFPLLFLSSVPFWWVFEWLNGYLGNWHYREAVAYSTVAYVLLSSIAFSTVVPAVLETAELLAGLGIGDRLPTLPAWRLRIRGIVFFNVVGWLMLLLVILFPRQAFPLAWLSVFFIVEPLNTLFGQRSIGRFVAEGDWAALWNVMLGALVTGFFWEMWNFYALPKWTYSIPYVGVGHVFEMPILGYSGYLPFGLEVFAVFALFFTLVFRKPQRYAIVSDKTRSTSA